MAKPKWSVSERKALIELARLKGWADEKILKTVIVGVAGAHNRKKLVVEWGELLGLDASEALRTARRAGLILTTRPPRND